MYNAIVWQDRRTKDLCEKLKNNNLETIFQNKTGLLLDPYFSGTKIKWILENHPDLIEIAKEGKLAFGTIDTWLIWKLTNGTKHVTDVTNASRTLLFNIHTLKWDEELINLLNIPKNILPELVSSSEFIDDINVHILGAKIPLPSLHF